MQHAEPDPAIRLLTVVEAVAARADEASRRLDDLTASLDELEGSGQREAGGAVDPADPLRIAAIELAVGGADRAETAELLAQRFPGAELELVLDDVF